MQGDLLMLVQTLPPFGLCQAAGFILALFMLDRTRRRHATTFTYQYVTLCAVVLVGVVFGGIGHHYVYGDAAGEIDLIDGGQSFICGIAGVALCVAAADKSMGGEISARCGMMVPVLLVMQIAGKIGCALAGCCYGRECAPAVGVWNEHVHAFVLPAQLFDVVLLSAMFLVLQHGASRISPPLLWHRYLAGYGLLRIASEQYRGDSVAALGPLSIGSILAMMVVAIGFVGLRPEWRGMHEENVRYGV